MNITQPIIVGTHRYRIHAPLRINGVPTYEIEYQLDFSNMVMMQGGLTSPSWQMCKTTFDTHEKAESFILKLLRHTAATPQDEGARHIMLTHGRRTQFHA